MKISTQQEQRRKGGKRFACALLSSVLFAWSLGGEAAAEIVNTVVASGTINGNQISVAVDERVDVVDQIATVAISKTGTFIDSNGNSTADVGETVNYAFTVTNTGNVTLTNVVLTDTKAIPSALALLPADDVAPGGDSFDNAAAGWASLAPGDTLRATASYALVQDDVDAGEVQNIASVTSTTIPGLTVTDTTTALTPLSTNSSFSLEKLGTLNLGNGVAEVGDVVTYQFRVTNTGPTTLRNVYVEDPLLLMASLPGANKVQELVQLASTAADPMTTASIEPLGYSGGARREPHEWVAPVPEIPAALHVERKLLRLNSSEAPLLAGERIGIYFKLTNTGNGPLTNISVSTPGAEAFGSTLDVLPQNTTDAASIIFTYVLTEEDVLTGQIDLSSTAYAKSRNASLHQTLSGILSLADAEMSGDIATASILPANVLTLAPGATTVFTATYGISQADIDAGQVLNTATAFATNNQNTQLQTTDDVAVAIPQTPGIAVDKTGVLSLGPDNTASVGDVITYTFTVSNIGNTTLDNVRLADPLPNINLSAPPFDDLAPGDDRIFTGTYALTQADIDAGRVVNQANVSAQPPGGAPRETAVSDDPATAADLDETVVLIPLVPSIALVKEIQQVADTNGSGMTDAGDEVTYSFRVRNTGNTSLTDVYVRDRNAAVVSNLLPPSGVSLAVGQTDTATFTARYLLTQADADRGFFDNTADAYGTAPDNTIVEDESDPAVYLQDSPTHLAIPAVGRIAVLKPLPTHIDNNNNTAVDLGDRLDYAINVINLGNVTLRNVRVTDPVAGGLNVVIPAILPGAANQVVLSASHTINAADVAAGRVSNLAFAETRLPDGTVVRDTSDPSNMDENDPTVTPITPRAEVVILKPQPQILDSNASGATDAGDTLRYTFTVINTGNVDLTTITVSDPLGTVVSTFVAPLEPGETDNTSFTMNYTLTAADLALGRVVNRASVVAGAAGGLSDNDQSHPSNQNADGDTITYVGAPALAVVKTATVNDVDGDGLIEAGEFIDYAFTIRNVGSQNLTNITLTDVNATISPAGGMVASLLVGEQTTYFTGRHTVTQADINQGFVQNQATAQGFFGALQVEDDSHPNDFDADAPTITPLTQQPGIAIVKGQPSLLDLNDNGIAEPGETLTYHFHVTNVGNVPLYDIVVSDNNADAVSGGPLATLAPGATDTNTFTATRLITPADAEAEQIVNQATVRAATATGGALTEEDLSDATSLVGGTPTVTPIAPLRPALSKTAARSEVRRGETVAYTIAASGLGIGPYDLTDIMPTGFDFVAGTAKVNDVATVPVQSGQTLSFAAIAPTVQGRITITLTLRASASLATGDFVNRARIYHTPTGALLGEARAVVKIKEEHVFDCGEIIGRVFDDVNNNGYMDNGEVGLPGVRVVTVNGLLVTTDKHGRFHVSCADVPDAFIGSNFLMKLDPRTLPAGYALTSENPRDVRLTRGKITKINFGASKRRDITLDLTKDAFAGGVDLKPKFAVGIDRLVGLLDQSRGQLTITYRCGVYAPIADERLEAVEGLLQTKWKQEGQKRPLKITTRVECGK